MVDVRKYLGANGERGAVRVEQAYAQGKMLESTGWGLPRNITPSDLDFAVENYNTGSVVIAEFSSMHSKWNDVPQGQKRLYWRFVEIGRGRITAALAKHSVPIDRKINTANDVDTFDLMWWNGQAVVCLEEPHPGERWQAWLKASLFNQAWPQRMT